MTDFDRTRFDRILPVAAGPADWEDVMRRVDASGRRRRRDLLIVLAAVAIIVIGTASAYGLYGRILTSGSTGLPPEGAAASTPEAGKLLIRYDGRPELSGFPARFAPVYQVWVFADGRVIWRRENGAFGVKGAAGEVRTGFLERRLTPEGVALLRSRLASTGLFDRTRFLLSAHGLAWGQMQLRSGDGVVRVVWCCSPFRPTTAFLRRAVVSTREQARAVSRLTAVLVRPASFLPARAWRDSAMRAYVPSHYAVCYWRARAPDYFFQSLEPSRVLTFLPSAARELLRDRDRVYEPFKDWMGHPSGVFEKAGCSEITTKEARVLSRVLASEGFEREPYVPPHPMPFLNFRFRAPAPHGTVFLAFEPILPHGEWEALSG